MTTLASCASRAAGGFSGCSSEHVNTFPRASPPTQSSKPPVSSYAKCVTGYVAVASASSISSCSSAARSSKRLRAAFASITSAASISGVISGGAPSRAASTDAADARGRLNAYARTRRGSNLNVRVASTEPAAGAASSTTCPDAHPTKTASPESAHANAVTEPGASANPIGLRPVPFSRSHAKNHTLPSSPAVASSGRAPAFAAGAYAAQVTAPTCGFTASTSFQASAQRSSARATPSPKPTIATRPSSSTAGGARLSAVAGASKRAANTSRFSAYAKTRTLPSSPAVTTWSLTRDASNA